TFAAGGGGSVGSHVVTKAADLHVVFVDRPSATDGSRDVEMCALTTALDAPIAPISRPTKKHLVLARIAMGVLWPLGSACEPPLDVGEWKCTAAPLFHPPDGSTEVPGRDTSVEPSWHSGFEDGFCGYARARGFCYSAPDATYRVV